MQSEFLLLNDYTDKESCSTSICRPDQIMDSIIDIKQSGSNVRKIYTPNVGENARVYTYNFKTKEVELDEILAIEHIIGEFDQYRIKSYKTSPVCLTNYDQLSTNMSRMNPNPKFIGCNRLSNYSTLLLQVELYNNIADSDDIVMVAKDETGEIEIPMTYDIGLFIGSWLGNGSVRSINSSKNIEIKLHPKYSPKVHNIIQDCFPGSFEVLHMREGRDYTFFNISDGLLASWLENSHGLGSDKQLPSAYYSAPEEFIKGLIKGLINSTGRVSINTNKNVLYCTLASQSELLIQQVIEILSLYLCVPANLSKFQLNNKRYLYIANIRITDLVYEKLELDLTDEQKKYIPNSNISILNGFSDIATIMKPNIELLKEKVPDTYMFRLRNNNNIIGLNGLIYKCKVGLRL